MKAKLVRRLAGAVAFALAALAYVSALEGGTLSWLVAMIASLFLLTVGFFLVEGEGARGSGARRGIDAPEDLDSEA